MAISVVMPALEMAQENGKLLAWRKREGESVSKGEPLLEIETDKAVVEIEAPADGILAGITAEVGAVIPVGETIAWLVAPGEKPPGKAATAAPAARATTAQAAAASPAQARPPVAAGVAAQISPKARRLAKELGVDIGQIEGTGPGGTITSEDVQAVASAKGAAALTPAHEPLSQLARLMAERTTESWTSVPHFFLLKSVDCGALVEAQKKLSAGSAAGSAPTITDLLVKLIGRVLEKHPRMNASWARDRIRVNPEINISVAMAVKDGVVGAVIPNAN
jgi:pyruvate dehydrogenase E2 component (dihydrolipoamide acetyltransferase)